MKKITKAITFLSSFMLFANVTHADGACPDLTQNSGFHTNIGVNFGYQTQSGESRSSHFSLYEFKGNGARFTGYCRDAGKSYGKGSDKYVGTQLLNPNESESLVKNIYDAGVIAILKNGYDINNPKSYNGLSNDEAYAATTIALRVFYLYNPLTTEWAGIYPLNAGFEGYANDWEPTFRKQISDAYKNTYMNNDGVYKPKSTAGKVLSITNNGNTTDIKDSVESFAKKLISDGFTAAINYRKNSNLAEFKISKPTKSKKEPYLDDDGNTIYRTTVNYVIYIRNFNSINSSVSLNFNCPECSYKGVSYSIKINNKDFGSGSINISNVLKDYRLISDISGGSATLNVSIEFSASSADYDCDDISYNLSGTYYDETISTTACEYLPENCQDPDRCQNFYVLYAKNSPISWKAEEGGNTVNLCDESCTDLETKCEEDKENGNPNSSACQRFKEKYNSVCPDCSSYVGYATCSKDESSFDVKEGYKKDASTCGKPTTLDVKSCIINNSDSNGNSYKATDLVSNNYCSVYCTEDYHFTMPGIKYDNSIRSVDLKVKIEGTKRCYTTNVDKNKFEEDIDKYQKEIVNNFNLYSFYAAMENRTTMSIGNGYSDSLPEHTHTYMADCDVYSAEHDDKCKLNKNTGRYQKSVTETKPALYAWGGTSYGYKWRFSAWKYDEETNKISMASVSDLNFLSDIQLNNNNWTISCTGTGMITCEYRSYGSDAYCFDNKNSSTHYCIDGSNGTDITTAYSNSISTYKETAKTNKDRAQTNLNSVISKYNSCGDWAKNMTYNFNPKVGFDYQEEFMNNVQQTYLNATTSGVPAPSNAIVSRCTSEANKSYESCPTNWKTNDQYSGDNTFVTRAFVKCNDTICVTENKNITSTVNMKAEMSVSAEYVAPRDFVTTHPSGGVLSKNENIDIQNSTDINNGLPVGAQKRGYYKYLLYISNLGEYYSKKTDELGRIWGAENSVVSYNLKETKNCRVAQGDSLKLEDDIGHGNHSGGVYVCQYGVNIPDCKETSDNVCDPYCEDDPDCPTPPCSQTPDGVCDYNCPNDPDCDDICPDCPVVCIGSKCYVEDERCTSGQCPITCPTCIYNDGLNVESRPITPDNLNPSDRDLGANWNSGVDPDDPKKDVYIVTSRQLKAYATTIEIMDNGNEIYDVDFNDSDGFAMEFTMDSGMISRIKRYNNEQVENGGYANNTLMCYDYQFNGKTYKNIFCYSTFLDDLLADNKTNSKIKIKGNRIMSENERKVNSATSGYWTTWDKATANKKDWHVILDTRYSLEYYTQNYGYDSNKEADYGIGPSWK